MNYLQTFESYIVGILNEASGDSLQNLQARIKNLTATAQKLKAKDFNELMDKKKSALDSAKESKDNLRTQVAQRNLNIVKLRMQKHQLRTDMVSKEIDFLNQKLTYQQESLKIKDAINNLRET